LDDVVVRFGHDGVIDCHVFSSQTSQHLDRVVPLADSLKLC
jgi:hypothetical protein